MGCRSGQTRPREEDLRAFEDRLRQRDSQISAQRAGQKLADWGMRWWRCPRKQVATSEAFVEEVVYLLPEGPAWFSADMETDQPLEVMIAEFVREKILRNFFDEVPRHPGVRSRSSEFAKGNLARIYAVIYV